MWASASCENVLWRPVGRAVRFVWIDHLARGRLLPMTTDLQIDPLQVYVLYGLPLAPEESFKPSLHALGIHDYHF